MEQKNEVLFVYGTLLKIADHMMSGYLEQNATCLGKGYIHGKMYEVMHYPGAVLSESPDEKVRGEVYLLHDAPKSLAELDAYEEIIPGFPEPYEFRREKTLIHLDENEESDEPLTGWVYLYNLPVQGLMQITSGDYEQFLKSRK